MRFRALWWLLCCLLLVSVAAAAPATQAVDSGSFGIFVNGKRVATETFSVQQYPGGSTANSQVRIDDGSKNPTQTAELQITSTGELKRYEWHQFTPIKAEAVVTPSDPFLIEHLTPSPEQKPIQQPFMMPTSTMILDNNFFLLRQLLAWRYMAGGCKQSSGNTECQLAPAKFGVLVPQALTSMLVNVAYTGREKVSIRGTPRELTRLNMTTEGSDWALWLDDNYKLIRIVVNGENTEVVRD